MKKIVFVAMFVFSIMLTSAAYAQDYLILHEPGYTQEVVVDNFVNRPYGDSASCVDWEGNFYFIAGDNPMRNTIKKVTPDGTITDFATSIGSGFLGQLQIDVYGNLYVVDNVGSIYLLVRISGFKPLSEVFAPPQLASVGNKNVYAGNVLEFQLEANDPDSPILVYSAQNLPQGATFNPNTHTFSWTPIRSQIGEYPSVRFQVTDGLLWDYEDITILVKKNVKPSDLRVIME